jgi:small subunit ribosomal protein S4
LAADPVFARFPSSGEGNDGWCAAAVEIARTIGVPPERAEIEAIMSRRQNAKYKLDRRVGENVWGRPKSPINSRQTRPGQHGARRTSKPSDFGLQLMAKQKLKGFYGDITEKQFRKTYEEASRRTGNTAELLVGLLESRLDTVVYRAKFVPTIFAARQFVNHGHVTLNGKKANIGSIIVKPGDVVQVREKSRNMALVIEAMGSSERDVPEYVEVDQKAGTAKFVRMPALSDIPFAAKMEPNLVVEFYSS